MLRSFIPPLQISSWSVNRSVLADGGHRWPLASMGKRSGPLPAVSATILIVLNWWCEETDHTADGICNLLWSHEQLALTSDPTQVRVQRRYRTSPPAWPASATRARAFAPSCVADRCSSRLACRARGLRANIPEKIC